MTILTPIWLQAGVYPAKSDRTVIAELWEEGLLSADSFVVTQTSGGPTYAVDVSAGRAIIEGDDEPDQGRYLVKSDDVETVAWPAPPGTNSRIDILVLRVNDQNAGGPAGGNATLVVVSGAAAASPTAPAIPDTAIELARVTVVAAQTIITDGDIVLTDRIGALPKKVLDDGSVPMDADLAMGGNKVTGLAAGTAGADAVNKTQLDGKLSLSGGAMTGAIAMGSSKVTGLANGTAAADAVNKGQLDATTAAFVAVSGTFTYAPEDGLEVPPSYTKTNYGSPCFTVSGGVFTCTRAGLYAIKAQIKWGANDPSRFWTGYLTVNGVQVHFDTGVRDQSISYVESSVDAYLEVGQTFFYSIEISGGASVTVGPARVSAHLIST
jgi:hypothetical protein